MTQPVRMDAKTAHQELTEHPHYRYRGCASDPDDPRMAAGNLELSVNAWQSPTVDGGEDRDTREAREAAACEVCVECPVMVQCLAYGSSLTPDGVLAEQHSILGGRTALERHKAFIAERKAQPVPVESVPVEQLRTPQKLAVLRAWAVHEAAGEVARAAGLDVRTANWQRARITTQLGLGKSASRLEVLEAAVARGLLRRDEVVADPGPAVPVPAAVVGVGSVQLSFDDVLASVTELFPVAPVLGVAA